MGMIGTDTAILYAIKQNAWPIGSVWLTVTNENPAKLFGGKWEQLPDIGTIHAWKRTGG